MAAGYGGPVPVVRLPGALCIGGPPIRSKGGRRFQWGKRYPSIAGTWQRAWSEFVPFLGLPDAIRQVVHTTNAIESVNARFHNLASGCWA